MGPADLSGYTVAVTADRRREEQVVMLSRLGLTVREFPLLRTSPADQEALRSATSALIERPPDMLLANTGYGMRTWLGLAREWGCLDSFVDVLGPGTVIGARGAKAVGELRKVGLDAVFRAPHETLEELVTWATGQGVEGQRVALQLHGETSDAVVAKLEAAGAEVVPIVVYRMGEAEGHAAHLVEAIVRRELDLVTFTAAPQVEALLEAASDRDLLGQVLESFNSGAVLAACIGPVCAAAVIQGGIRDALVPEHARLGSLATAIFTALAKRTTS